MTADLERHDKLVGGLIVEYGGEVFKQMGDAFLAAFEDPESATRAAIEINRRLPEESWEAGSVQVRTVVHTGRAQRRKDDYMGLSLSVAARLMHVAHGGQVLVSEPTAALLTPSSRFELRGLGRVELRDIARPVQVYQVVAEGLKVDFPPLLDPDARMRGFPTETASFVGRAREVSEVAGLLSTNRLVTLIGPGGIGKTRLATRVASSVTSTFDSLWFVDLAGVSEPDVAADTIATAVAPSGEGDSLERVAAALRSGSQLLVLDNLEHLAPGVSESIKKVLADTSDLRILATSRSPLHLRAEQLYPVPSLAADGVDAAAVELFAERARQVDPDFDIDEHLEGVVEICRLVDGLPLGIELAAARVRLFAPRVLAERLRQGTPLAGGAVDLPDRHRSLAAAVSWSVDLLDEAGQRLYRRIGVFAGGADLTAVEAVCSYPGEDVFSTLESLIDLSLVRPVPGRLGQRFSMLEMVRADAVQRLRDSDEADEIGRRHAMHFAALVEQAEPYLRSDQQAHWFLRLDEEIANLRAALEWSASNGEVDLAARILAYGTDHLFYRSLQVDASRWVELVRPHLDDINQLHLGMVHLAIARHHFMRNELEETRHHADLAIRFLYDSDDKRHLALAHVMRASSGLGIHEILEESVGHAREAVTIAEELGHVPIVAQGLNIWGELVRLDGDLEESIPIQEQARQIAIEGGEFMRVAMLDHNLGIMAYNLGRPEAGRLLLAAVDRALDLNFSTLVLGSLIALAGPVSETDPTAAARMIGSYKAESERTQDLPQPADKADYEMIERRVRDAAGHSYEALEAEGRLIDPKPAVDLAREALGLATGDDTS
jgi:predicted ATPase